MLGRRSSTPLSRTELRFGDACEINEEKNENNRTQKRTSNDGDDAEDSK